jgi:hypothetical protein
MSSASEITVGLTAETHEVLKQLKEDGVFSEMRDAYRFGLALAIARKKIVPQGTKMGTFLNVGSLDPDGAIRSLVLQLFPEASDRPYRYAERLAEWGVAELGRMQARGRLDFGEIFASVGLRRERE